MSDGLFRQSILGCEQSEARWGLWILLVFLALPMRGQGGVQDPTDGTEGGLVSLADAETASVERVRRDTEGDFVPDRKGDTVHVAGRVSAQRGIHPVPEMIFLQDETGGIAVDLPDGPRVERGDSLRVRGVVRQKYGLTQLEGLSYSKVDEGEGGPEPLLLTVSAAEGEEYEGRLVRLRARVISNRTNEGGQYLLLKDREQDATARVAAFVPNHRLDQFDLDRFEVGTEVTVTGPLGQYDYSAPQDGYYQVLPRDPDDVRSANVISAYYRTAIVLVIAGALLAVVVVVTLRTAVKRRTEQLTESRARFRRLAEATFEGIIIHEEGEILNVNRALTHMIGYEREELVGRSFLDVLSESTRKLVRETVQPGPEEPYEAVMVRKDGSSFPAEIEEKVVDVPNRDVRVAAVRDITERKKRETEMLLAKEEAEEMAQLKSSLLNNMSHELRTPITSIIGYAELIMNEPEADHQTFAARIRQSGRRLSRTVRAVIEMAQLESGTLDVQPTNVEVMTLVQNVIEEHRPMIDGKSLTLDVCGTAPETPLYTDRGLMYRALGNLVHNAIKFTETGTVQVDVEPTHPGVRIAVSDTGVGIDADFQEQLFEPFKQESEGRARTHGGTGLGLALTKRMVDLLGGTIEVESVKEKGSTFILELPPVIPSETSEVVVTETESA